MTRIKKSPAHSIDRPNYQARNCPARVASAKQKNLQPIRVIRGSPYGLMQVVHFHERNSSGVVYPTHDGGVVTRWEVCDDRRFPRVRRSVAAVLNVLDLVLGDDAADYRMLPVVVGGNQSSGAIVQFQCRISQGIRNAKLAELRANGTYDHVLWLSPLYDEPANHHVVASLNKTTSTDIA